MQTTWIIANGNPDLDLERYLDHRGDWTCDLQLARVFRLHRAAINQARIQNGRILIAN